LYEILLQTTSSVSISVWEKHFHHTTYLPLNAKHRADMLYLQLCGNGALKQRSQQQGLRNRCKIF